MSLKIKRLADHVLVEPTEENEVKKGGIIIPDTAKEKPTEGGNNHRVVKLGARNSQLSSAPVVYRLDSWAERFCGIPSPLNDI